VHCIFYLEEEEIIMTEEILSAINGEVYGVWFLIGAALVFWMQAGFAMVETGFTRAKNAGNILMKNLMDFCIGTVVFILIGFGLFLGEDMVGLIGKPGFDIFTDYANFDWSNFVFNLVFCATTATIVSGSMAERTKFLSYCVYSAIISAVIYPIEAHWTWGGGWLAQIGFHDFAGSNCIHMVGGISALIGAAMLGPRIGKFVKDGKDTYYLTDDNNIITGWVKYSGKWYYFDTVTGKMKTGFLTVDNRKFYLSPSTGEMCTGWITVKGAKYLATGNGSLVTNTYYNDGLKTYKFNASGKKM